MTKIIKLTEEEQVRLDLDSSVASQECSSTPVLSLSALYDPSRLRFTCCSAFFSSLPKLFPLWNVSFFCVFWNNGTLAAAYYFLSYCFLFISLPNSLSSSFSPPGGCPIVLRESFPSRATQGLRCHC